MDPILITKLVIAIILGYAILLFGIWIFKKKKKDE